jgi:plasmid maintenance system killer protein
LIWDKYTGNVRIDFPGEKSTYLININEDSGRVKIGERELTKTDSLDKYIERGKQIWVNDSYWLVFPFKLKDPGVQLKYVGQDTIKNGNEAEVISLSFEKVGFTPQNKYKAYIDPQSHMILQWDFYRNASDSVASFKNLWTDYQKYGDIMLSSGRGERELKNIKVAQKWNDTAFEEF